MRSTKTERRAAKDYARAVTGRWPRHTVAVTGSLIAVVMVARLAMYGVAIWAGVESALWIGRQ